MPYTSEERLIDPVTNERFVYELRDDGFVLYSTGMETHRYDPAVQPMKTEHRIIPIWPRGWDEENP